MLTKLVMENFMSFKNRTELDFLQTPYALLPHHVADNGVLKGAVFVGANASGKSNALKAFSLLLIMLFAERKMKYTLFASLLNTKKTFYLHYHFLIQGVLLRYEIAYDVVEEHFTETLFSDDTCLLRRIGSEADTYISEHKHYDASDIANDTLFLRTLYFNTKFQGQEVLQEWMVFLKNSQPIHPLYGVILSEKSDPARVTEYLEKHDCDAINDFLKVHNFQQTIYYVRHDEAHPATMNLAPTSRILFQRENVDMSLIYALESDGNKALIALLPMLFQAIQRPCMLVIDEFSSHLHNELEELLITYFMRHARHSQLFVASHSTNLLSNTIIRADQVYAVEFQGAEGSIVKRFSQENPRPSQNMERMYMSGVFGGLPRFHRNNEG